MKRVDGEVAALGQRIKALDDNLAKSEQYIKTATAALADAVAMEVERRKNAGEEEAEDNNDPLSQFDAQMAVLEGKLLEAKYLASKVSQIPNVASTTISSPSSEEKQELDSSRNAEAAPAPPLPKPNKALRRPFPVP